MKIGKGQISISDEDRLFFCKKQNGQPVYFDQFIEGLLKDAIRLKIRDMPIKTFTHYDIIGESMLVQKNGCEYYENSLILNYFPIYSANGVISGKDFYPIARQINEGRRNKTLLLQKDVVEIGGKIESNFYKSDENILDKLPLSLKSDSKWIYTCVALVEPFREMPSLVRNFSLGQVSILVSFRWTCSDAVAQMVKDSAVSNFTISD